MTEKATTASTRAIKQLLEAEYGQGKVSVRRKKRGYAGATCHWFHISLREWPPGNPWSLPKNVITKVREAGIPLDYDRAEVTCEEMLPFVPRVVK